MGRTLVTRKVAYRAYASAVCSSRKSQSCDHVGHIQWALEFLGNQDQFQVAKTRIMAYRISPQNVDAESNSNLSMQEAFDDSGEEGAGEKLLHLL